MISPLDAVSSAASQPAKTPPATKDLASKEVFLQLLVAQLKNQNPLSPQDGMQFVTQLAQFSGLEQNIAMKEDLAKIREALTQKPDTTTQTL